MNTAIRNIRNDNARAFAVAAYDGNDLSELIEMVEVDETDMKTWEIDADQWKSAIDAALNDRLHDWVLAYVEGCESNGVDPREVVAEKFNVDIEDVEIDKDGDIHTGHWLNVQQLADFVEWHERTYG